MTKHRAAMASSGKRRTIVVGDVHGCLEELEDLLDLVELGPGDRLVLVGDLVAKGPDSAGVVRLVRSLGAEAVLGNHDHALLELHRGKRPDAPDALKKVAKKLDDADWKWLSALPYTVAIPEHASLVVHGGLVPGVPIANQDPELMLTMRSIRRDGSGSKRIEDGVAWGRRWIGPPHVYYGHDAVRGLQRYADATGLDTGCVYGGNLTGCVLPGRQIVQVKARRTYAEPGKAAAARYGEAARKK